MTDLDWTALEDAVLAALQAQLGTQVVNPGNLPGGLAGRPANGGLAAARGADDAGGTRAAAAALRSYDLTLDFTMLVVVRQFRGQAAGRPPGGRRLPVPGRHPAGPVASRPGSGNPAPGSGAGGAAPQQPAIYGLCRPVPHRGGGGSCEVAVGGQLSAKTKDL